MTKLWGVQKTEIDQAWPLVAGLITEAVERGGRHTPEEVREDIASGDAQLWVTWVDDEVLGVCVTFVIDHKRMKLCRIWLCTGHDRKQWAHHLQGIEDWAKSIGCDAIDGVVRPGWEKVMRDYKKTHVVLEKKL